MSLFSIVQGRAAPPMPAVPPMTHVMPDGTVMQGPPMYMTGGYAALPGYMHGGMEHIGFEEDYAPAYIESPEMDETTRRYMEDGVMNIPGYQTPPPGTITFNDPATAPTFQIGMGGGGGGDTGYTGNNQIDGMIDNFILNGATPEQARRMAIGQYDANQQARTDQLSGAGRGPDHFYEQLAFNTEKDAKDRADAQALADAQMKATQQSAMADWHKAQMAAANVRQNNITSAGAQAQNAFVSALGQADPSQTPLYFAPQLLYEDAKFGSPNPDAAAADTNAPNLPGYVFDPNRGY